MRMGNVAVKKLLGRCLLLFAALVASCGGGSGGGGNNPAAASGGSWDSLVWNQGDWQ